MAAGMITIRGVPAPELDVVWGAVAPLVSRALDKTHEHKFKRVDDFYCALAERDMQLWLIEEDGHALGVGITEILHYPECKVLTCVMLSGAQRARWFDHAQQILVGFGRHHGCRYVQLFGRRGWVKALAAHGWQEKAVHMIKEL